VDPFAKKNTSSTPGVFRPMQPSPSFEVPKPLSCTASTPTMSFFVPKPMSSEKQDPAPEHSEEKMDENGTAQATEEDSRDENNDSQAGERDSFGTCGTSSELGSVPDMNFSVTARLPSVHSLPSFAPASWMPTHEAGLDPSLRQGLKPSNLELPGSKHSSSVFSQGSQEEDITSPVDPAYYALAANGGSNYSPNDIGTNQAILGAKMSGSWMPCQAQEDPSVCPSVLPLDAFPKPPLPPSPKASPSPYQIQEGHKSPPLPPKCKEEKKGRGKKGKKGEATKTDDAPVELARKISPLVGSSKVGKIVSDLEGKEPSSRRGRWGKKVVQKSNVEEKEECIADSHPLANEHEIENSGDENDSNAVELPPGIDDFGTTITMMGKTATMSMKAEFGSEDEDGRFHCTNGVDDILVGHSNSERQGTELQILDNETSSVGFPEEMVRDLISERDQLQVRVVELEERVAMWRERAEAAAIDVVGAAAMGAAATVAAVEGAFSPTHRLGLGNGELDASVIPWGSTSYANSAFEDTAEEDVPRADVEAELSLVTAELAEVRAELSETQEGMDDLLVCLGQESSKVERLTSALEDRGVDVNEILADLVQAEDAEIDALVGAGAGAEAINNGEVDCIAAVDDL